MVCVDLDGMSSFGEIWSLKGYQKQESWQFILDEGSNAIVGLANQDEMCELAYASLFFQISVQFL